MSKKNFTQVRVYAREMETKTEPKRKFISMSVISDETKSGNFVNLKVSESAKDELIDNGISLPKKKGYYLLTINDDAVEGDYPLSISKKDGKKTIWLSNGNGVISFERDVEYEEKRKQENQQELNVLIKVKEEEVDALFEACSSGDLPH